MKFYLCLILFCISSIAMSQVKIGSNPSVINPFSLLELESTDKGLLLPRIQTATGLALMGAAPDGMMVYYEPDASIYVKRAGGWAKVNSNWSVAGNNISNGNTGNVGIGSASPDHAKLEVSGFVGNVAGLFGNGINSGVSLNVGFPEVGFNYYFSGSNKGIAPGYAAVIGLNPTTGNLYVGNFNNNQAPAAFSDIPGYVDRLVIRQNGDVGIGIIPTEKLEVVGTIKLTGEVNRSSTGAANLLPIAYGKVRNDGVILGGTGNFIIAKTGVGLYEITLANETNVYNNQSLYMVQATVESSVTRLLSVDFKINNNIQIRTAQPKINYTNAFCNSCSDVYSYITTFSASQDEDNTFSFFIYKL